MTTTDSDRLLADGIPVTLADGVHHLRFTMRGLKVLEDRFDGIDNVTEFLAGKASRRFGPLTDMLAAALAHEGMTHDAVEEAADPARYNEYLSALVDALDVAFPAARNDSSPKAEAPTGSNGAASTTSQPSGSVAAIPTSGQ